MRYYFGKIVVKFLTGIKIFDDIKTRKVLINMLFYNMTEKELKNYFEKTYKKIFFDNLTDFGKKTIKKDNKKNILLTGCTEIPAIQIGEIFNFRKIICTTFRYKNGKIKGINKDTYGNLKMGHIIKRKNDYFIYYNDDINTENELEKIMDEINLINGWIWWKKYFGLLHIFF